MAIVDRKTWVHSKYDHIWYTTDEGASVGRHRATREPRGRAEHELLRLAGMASARWSLPHSGADPVRPGGNLESQPGDVSSWSTIPGSPQGQLLMPTGKNIVVAGTLSATYSIASQSDVTTWMPFRGPPLASPPSGSLGAIPEGTAYDGVHHVLYVTTDTTRMWRTVVE